jgi:uncharacterized membrane protein YgcG
VPIPGTRRLERLNVTDRPVVSWLNCRWSSWPVMPPLAGAGRLPRRTATGRALAQRVAGHRAYLQSTALATSPGRAPSCPSARSLAYAMVFDLTAQWHSALRHALAAGTPVGSYPFWSDRFVHHTDAVSSWGSAPAHTVPSPSLRYRVTAYFSMDSDGHDGGFSDGNGGSSDGGGGSSDGGGGGGD